MSGSYGFSDPRNQSSRVRPETSGDPVAPLARSRVAIVEGGNEKLQMVIDLEAPTTQQVLEGQVALKGSGVNEVRVRPESVSAPVATVVTVPDTPVINPDRDSDSARSPQVYQPQALSAEATDSVDQARQQLADYFATEGAQ